MNVLVGCEYSGRVRDAFAAKGHNAWSCDLKATEAPGNHYQESVFDVLRRKEPWDLFIWHPPCTVLTSAGQWYYKQHPDLRDAGVAFFMEGIRLSMYIPRVCTENPAGIMTKLYRKPDQTVDPYFFGEPERKRTCLWLRGLPRLNGLVEVARDKKAHAPEPSYIYADGRKGYFTDRYSGNSKNGGHNRSRSFLSIANAMAEQWNF
jgi:hypothetical protein